MVGRVFRSGGGRRLALMVLVALLVSTAGVVGAPLVGDVVGRAPAPVGAAVPPPVLPSVCPGSTVGSGFHVRDEAPVGVKALITIPAGTTVRTQVVGEVLAGRPGNVYDSYGWLVEYLVGVWRADTGAVVKAYDSIGYDEDDNWNPVGTAVSGRWYDFESGFYEYTFPVVGVERSYELHFDAKVAHVAGMSVRYWLSTEVISGNGGSVACSPLDPSENFGPSGSFRYQCDCTKSTANAIDTRTGNEHLTLPGLVVPGRGPALGFGLAHNSLDPVDVGLGAGWRHSYAMRLVVNGDGSRTLVQETGATVTFWPAGADWVAPPRHDATLVANGDGSWSVTRNGFEELTFDSSGRLVTIEDSNGYVTVIDRDAGNPDLIDFVEEPGGRRLTFAYSSGQLTSVTDPLGRVLGFGYDAGRLKSYTDVGGGVWTLFYDGSGRLDGFQRPVHHGTTKRWTFHYDSAGRVDWEEDELGRRTTLAFDTPSVGSTTVTSPEGRVRVDWYNRMGQRWKVTVASGTADEVSTITAFADHFGPLSTVDGRARPIAGYGYDAAGNQVYVRDATGRESWAEFNARGQVTVAEVNTAAPGQAPVVVRSVNEYDAAGNLEKTTVDEGGLLEAVTDFQYLDGAHPGDLSRVVDARGKEWNYAYHPTRGDLLTVTDPEGNVSTSVTNAVGWTTSTVTPRGTVTGNPTGHDTLFTYDDYGQVETVTNPAGDVAVNVYDPDGGVLIETRTDLGVGDTDPEVTRYAYDDTGRVTGVVEASRVGATDTVVSTTGYGYDDDGLRTRWTNGNDHDWTYAYDAAGRLDSEADPAGNVTCYGYDDSGRLATRTLPDGGSDCDTTSRPVSITYTYDPAGRPTGVDYADPATADVSGITYDGAGRRLTAARAGGVTETWAWDRLGRLTSHGDANGRVTGYGWDPNGNLTQITYPGQAVPVTRAFDDANRLETVTDWAGRQTSFGYDENSQWTTTTFPAASGNVDVRTFDPSGRMTGVTWKRGATVLGSLAYTHDDESLVATSTATGAAAPSPASFGYDARDQLVARGTATLGLDPAGNLTETEDGRLQVFDPAQRLCWTSPTAATGACTTPASDATTYDYDERGNRTAATLPSGMESTFGYDAENRMTTAEVPGLGGPGSNQYQPVTPARVADSKAPTGVCDGATCAPLTSNDTVEVKVTGVGGVPAAGVTAVTGTVTVDDPTGTGSVEVNPNGQAAAATVFHETGVDATQSFTAEVASNGTITLTSTAAAHFQVDVTGYYTVPSWVPLQSFWPIDAERVAATAPPGSGTCNGVTCTTLAAGTTTVQVRGVGPVPATGVTAVAASVIVAPVAGSPAGTLRLAPNGPASAASISWESGAIGAVAATVPLDANGRMTVSTTAPVNIAVDVSGWWATPDPADLGTALHVLGDGPERVADTNTGTGLCNNSPCGRLTGGVAVDVKVAGQAGVPDGAVAAVVAVTMDDPAAAGSMLVNHTGWLRAGAIVVSDGGDASVTATVGLDADGTIEAVSGVATDLTVDVVGYFVRSTIGWTYTYDSQGLRKAKTSDTSADHQYTWTAAGGLPLLLAEHRGTATSYLIYGPGGTPLYQITANGTPAYYHQDHQGSTRLVTNPNGTTQGKLAYNAYGKPVTNTIPWTVEQPLLTYTSQYQDNETGYIYLRARYLDPTTAQFTTLDPLVHSTLEPYSYAGGDPKNRVDPDGLGWCFSWQAGCKSLLAEGAGAGSRRLAGDNGESKSNADDGANNDYCGRLQRYVDCVRAAAYAGMASRYAKRESGGNGLVENALRHCMWSALLAWGVGRANADGFLDRHESGNFRDVDPSSPGWNTITKDEATDRHNNSVGLQIGAKNSGWWLPSAASTTARKCSCALRNDRLRTT